MLVGNKLSTWARTWAGIGAAECAAIAASIHFRPTPIISFLPGTGPGPVAVGFALAAALLAAAAVRGSTRRYGMFTFGIVATIHAVYGVGAIGYAITMGSSWVLATAMVTLAALYCLAVYKIAGPKH